MISTVLKNGLPQVTLQHRLYKIPVVLGFQAARLLTVNFNQLSAHLLIGLQK